MDPELYNAAIYGSPDFGAKFKVSTDSHNDEQEITFSCGQNNTILHVAAKSGMLQIEEGDDHVLRFLYMQNKNGDTPLHIAAKMGHKIMTRILLEHAKTTDVEPSQLLRMVNMEKDTALHVAVRGNHLEVVELLIKEDEDLASLENGAGESPLFIAVDRCFFPVAFHILENAKNCSIVGSNGMNVLHAAVIRSRSWKVCSLGPTALFEITSKIVNVLWFNHRMTYKQSNNDIYLVVDYLRRSLRNTDKRDIVDVVLGKIDSNSIMGKADEFGWIPLHYAAYIGNKEAVDKLLKNSGSNTSLAYTRNKGMSALHLSAEKGHVSVIKMLIEKCPELCELLDDNDRTALHVAVECRKKNVVKFFLQSSVALPFQDLLNQKDKNNGNTALHLAAASISMRDFAILTMLAHDSRVDKGARNNEGMTFIDILLLSNKQSEFWENASWLKREVCLPSLAQKLSSMNKHIVDIDDEAYRKRHNASTSSSSSATDQEPRHGDGSPIKDTSDTFFWISSIIATVTFAAAVQVPGGYDANGLAVLRKSEDFFSFLNFDMSSFVSACLAMLIYLGHAIFFKKTSLAYTGAISAVVNSLILFSLMSMIYAFILGVAAVIDDDEETKLFGFKYNFNSDTAAWVFSIIACFILNYILLYKLNYFKEATAYLRNMLEALLLRLGFHGLLEDSLPTYFT